MGSLVNSTQEKRSRMRLTADSLVSACRDESVDALIAWRPRALLYGFWTDSGSPISARSAAMPKDESARPKSPVQCRPHATISSCRCPMARLGPLRRLKSPILPPLGPLCRPVSSSLTLSLVS